MHGSRTFLAATAAAIASLGTARCAAGRAGPAPGKTKTFVLLHVAWHGGWCWSRVAEPLRAAGHRVYTPTQTGLGERSHLISKNITLDFFVHDLVNVIQYEERGAAINKQSQQTRARRVIRELRSLGYRVEPLQLHRAARHERSDFRLWPSVRRLECEV